MSRHYAHRAVDRLLPASWTPNRVVVRVGIVSDTHLPPRLLRLPSSLFTALNGVDLVLHAGDVGDLSVLDQLSRIAPVVAVHGNDDTPAARQQLPYHQVMAVAGVRVLLWHSHYADPDAERASRRDEEMVPKFAWIASVAERAGASVAVFGHWHIPLIYRSGSVLLVNPGALAPSSFFERQLLQTAAVMFVDKEQDVHIAHVDLAAPDRPFLVGIDWQAGFNAAYRQFSATIVSPDLDALKGRLRSELSAHDLDLLIPVATRMARRVWSGELDRITCSLLADAVRTAPDLPVDLAARILRLLEPPQPRL